MPVQLVLRLEEERQDDGELSGMAGGGSGNAMGGGNQAGPEECNTLFLNCNFSLGSTSSDRDVVVNNQNAVLHCRECFAASGTYPVVALLRKITEPHLRRNRLVEGGQEERPSLFSQVRGLAFCLNSATLSQPNLSSAIHRGHGARWQSTVGVWAVWPPPQLPPTQGA